MAYYKTCPDCGANLDPGEKCDCKGKGLLSSNGNSPKKSYEIMLTISQKSILVKSESIFHKK